MINFAITVARAPPFRQRSTVRGGRRRRRRDESRLYSVIRVQHVQVLPLVLVAGAYTWTSNSDRRIDDDAACALDEARRSSCLFASLTRRHSRLELVIVRERFEARELAFEVARSSDRRSPR